MRSSLFLTVLLLAVTSSYAGAQDTLSLAIRGEAISAALRARWLELEQSTQVDACTVYEHLGRSPEYLSLLDTLVHPMLSSRQRDPCAEKIVPPLYQGWWRVEGITAEGPERIVVEAYYRVPRIRARREFYEIRHRADGSLVALEVRLGRSVESEWQPLIPPATAPSPPHP